jgi:phosphatidylserine/phosphatidylglycerophosphate/cardiolipin synthase-like enzyme
MVDLFVWRWYGATGERLDPARLVGDDDTCRLDFPVTLPMPRGRVGFARTIPEVLNRAQVSEVAELYVRAVESAERLIYVESQYLTSCALRDALLRRMAERSRPKLDIVVILPRKPAAFKEEMTVGVRQTSTLQLLDDAAREHGHALGIYNVLAGTLRREPLYVYIHAKLMIVDDRCFAVGSANLTNRSMTIDSELVAAYDTQPDECALRNAIRRARVRLLLEHAGEDVELKELVPQRGLVARLDALVRAGKGRLRKYDVWDVEQSVMVRVAHDFAQELIDLDPWEDEARTG